eukprot:gene1769-1933_t
MATDHLKILYVEGGVEEKSSADCLEHCLGPYLPTNLACAFYVTHNAFSALELIAYQSFSYIFIKENLKNLDANGFARILRSLGYSARIVLIVDRGSSIATRNDLNKLLFDDLIVKPFTARELYECIFMHSASSSTTATPTVGSVPSYEELLREARRPFLADLEVSMLDNLSLDAYHPSSVVTDSQEQFVPATRAAALDVERETPSLLEELSAIAYDELIDYDDDLLSLLNDYASTEGNP